MQICVYIVCNTEPNRLLKKKKEYRLRYSPQPPYFAEIDFEKLRVNFGIFLFRIKYINGYAEHRVRCRSPPSVNRLKTKND